MLKTHRAFKFRCYPTKEQEIAFRQIAGVRRFVWNKIHALTMGHERLSKALNGGVWKNKPSAFTLAKWVRKKLTKKYPWVTEHAFSQTVEAVSADYQEAWSRCFNKTAGKPCFKSKFKSHSSFYRRTSAAREKISCLFTKEGKSYFRYTKALGPTPFKKHREVEGVLVGFTISEKAGKWYVSFCCKVELELKQAKSETPVGLDVGVTDFACLSDGRKYELDFTEINKLQKKKKHHQRRLAVMQGPKRGVEPSRRWRERKDTIARIDARIARIRNYQHHQISRDLAESNKTVVVEKLNIKNMTKSAKGTVENPGKKVAQKSGLNRAILSQGWFNMKTQLKYKTGEYGGEVIEVDPRYTSQTCSSCGDVNAENRSGKHFLCLACGFEDDADVNAARNILSRNKKGPCVAVAGGKTRLSKRKVTSKAVSTKVL